MQSHNNKAYGNWYSFSLCRIVSFFPELSIFQNTIPHSITQVNRSYEYKIYKGRNVWKIEKCENKEHNQRTK